VLKLGPGGGSITLADLPGFVSASDSKPDFYELWRSIFWQVSSIGIMDIPIATIGLQSLIKWEWLISALFFILVVALHWAVYKLIAGRRVREGKKPRFEKSLFDAQS
jgi:hypothetical protein